MRGLPFQLDGRTTDPPIKVFRSRPRVPEDSDPAPYFGTIGVGSQYKKSNISHRMMTTMIDHAHERIYKKWAKRPLKMIMNTYTELQLDSNQIHNDVPPLQQNYLVSTRPLLAPAPLTFILTLVIADLKSIAHSDLSTM